MKLMLYVEEMLMLWFLLFWILSNISWEQQTSQHIICTIQINMFVLFDCARTCQVILATHWDEIHVWWCPLWHQFSDHGISCQKPCTIQIESEILKCQKYMLPKVLLYGCINNNWGQPQQDTFSSGASDWHKVFQTPSQCTFAILVTPHMSLSHHFKKSVPIVMTSNHNRHVKTPGDIHCGQMFWTVSCPIRVKCMTGAIFDWKNIKEKFFWAAGTSDDANIGS
jgi:hypothetical protein